MATLDDVVASGKKVALYFVVYDDLFGGRNDSVARDFRRLKEDGLVEGIAWKGMEAFLKDDISRILSGKYVYFGAEFTFAQMLESDFLTHGRCRFTLGRESIMDLESSLVFRKGSPLLTAFNSRYGMIITFEN